MLTNDTLIFLGELLQHNDREWFLAHKKRYETAHFEFHQFVEELISRITSFDPTIAATRRPAKDYIFRIYRDTRFSRDKSPYKTHFGAHVTSAAKRSDVHSRAGYYIHIQPDGQSLLAGGAYLPPAPWLAAIRSRLVEDGEKFRQILNSKSFTDYFSFEGESLKRPPRGFSKDTPHLDFIRRKSFIAVHSVPDAMVVAGKDFLDHGEKVFKALKPFDDFLNRAAV